VTHDDVQQWLDRYIEAWRSYDPVAIGDLFAEDIEYRYHPWDDPIVGRTEVVRAWVAPEGNQSQRDEPDSWEARYEPYAVDGDRAVAVGWSRYFARGDTPEGLYHNAYLLAFDAAGRCRAFTEYFVEQK
jgi:ketosteroid isomerase-like protein